MPLIERLLHPMLACATMLVDDWDHTENRPPASSPLSPTAY
ncbi:MAG: hypothetical protein WC340_00185 [Kiritimatiellia bacterium]